MANPLSDCTTLYRGEPLDVRLGETLGAAFQRRLAAKNAAAKPATPAVDPAIAAIRRLESERDKLRATVAAKESIAELKAKNDKLREQIARQESRKRGFAGHVKFGGGFNAFGKHDQFPKPAA